MRRMPGPPTRALHDRLLASLAASPKRDVAGCLPPGCSLDVDSFERRILGAERRLVRVGTVTGRPTAVPDSGQLVLLSCRNLDTYLVAITTLWKRGFVPLLADARQITGTLGVRPGDTLVTAIPLGHAYGFGHVLMSLVLQGTRPLLLEQPLPALLLEALSRPGPLVLPGTPYLFSLLLQTAGRKRFKGLSMGQSAV